MRHWSLLLLVATAGCDETLSPQPLDALSFTAAVAPFTQQFAASPSFADERGGGVFIDLAGRVARVRSNGNRAVLESHPGNPVWPGPASGVFALSGTSSLVATSRGVFVVGDGWLMAPAWRDVLPAEGIRQAVTGADGTTWLVHETGLFRLTRGALSEFKVGGESLSGIVALAVAPTEGGAQGLWFAREKKLFAATQTALDAFSVVEVVLNQEVVSGDVIGLAGLTPTAKTAGELWAITQHVLLRWAGTTWRQFELPGKPRALWATGRYAWLVAGDALYRYDGDAGGWQKADGLPGAVTLLGADAAGTALVRIGEETLSVSAGPVIRLQGLIANAQVFDGNLMVSAVLPGSMNVTALSWQFDELERQSVEVSTGVAGEGPSLGEVSWNLGGLNENSVLRPLSLAGLEDGWHTLTVTATADGRELKRVVHFQFAGASSAVVSYEADVRPIYETRCLTCHETTLTTSRFPDYESMKVWSARVVEQVTKGDMPPGGMDPGSVNTIVRWVNGGMLP